MPDCCKNCKCLKATNSCTIYHHCPSWRKWFKTEWRKIRKYLNKED